MRRALLLLGIAALMPPGTAAQTVEERARAAAAAAREKAGDSEALQQNYVTPGLSGQPLSTIDDSRTFTPGLACQKTQTLLEVLIQPSPTGDIGTVRISRDTDFDGAFDSSATLPMPVSGICANGVISCEPGTWKACRTFRWEVEGTGALKLGEAEMPELSGCYCVNQSCGANLVWGNMASVLKDLGGGMVGALTTADPRIGIAQARINGPVISYIGAQSTACSASPDLSQTAYRANPTAIQGDALAQAQTSEVFQALAASPAGAGKAEQTRSCTIEREVSIKSRDFDDIITVSGPLHSVTPCGPGCRRYRIQGEGTCGSSPPLYTARFDTHAADRLVSARIVEMGADDWVQGRVNHRIIGSAGKRPWLTDSLPSGDCRISGGNWRNHESHDITADLKAGATAVAARVRGGGGSRWGYVDVEIKVDTSCEVIERLVDLCSGYASHPQCRLVSEDVDGVETFRSGVATGLHPLPQTRLFGSASCTLQFTRPFFLRSRRYTCAIDAAALPEPDLSRAAYIIEHSTETQIADRLPNADGSYATTTRPFAMPERGTVAACEPVCKTRASRANIAAAPAGVVASQQNDPTGWDIFYHACLPGNLCPVGPGEEIVTSCGCIDDFPDAIVMMQTVRLAGADLACTAETR